MQPHIRLSKTMAKVRYALLPGDPQRVDRITQFLSTPEVLGQNREFRSARGWYHGIEILVLSTGIGGPSTAIAVEELRQIGVNAIIRIGSCGALQDYLTLGDIISANSAVAYDLCNVGGIYPAYTDGYYGSLSLATECKKCSYTPFF